MVTAEGDGKPYAPLMGARCVFAGTALRVKAGEGEEVLQIKLDPGAKPKAMDRARDFTKAVEVVAIYELSGDQLKICIDTSGKRIRPTDFLTKSGSDKRLLVLRRPKEKAPEPAPGAAAHLTKIDRTIAKEPVYKNKPKYCLLVFGPEAKARVWLVLDGEGLYVDRNSNGDLTEEGERSERTVGTGRSTFHEFEVRDLRPEGHTTSTCLHAWSYRSRAERVRLELLVDGKPWRVAGADEVPDGPLHFGDRPEHAPVVHIDGPLTFKVRGRDVPALVPGKKSSFSVYVGTPGFGIGSWTGIIGEMWPQSMTPVAEIELPPEKPGAQPTVVRLDLPLL